MAERSYRRKKRAAVWHFRADCSEWPASGYDSSPNPADEDLCEECQRKDSDHEALQALSDVLHGKRERKA